MFEGVKIRAMAETVADRLNLDKSDRETLRQIAGHSIMLPAAKSGLKKGLMSHPAVALAYLLADVVDAATRSDKSDDKQLAALADLAGLEAMKIAGATDEEARQVMNECIDMHHNSRAQVLDRMFNAGKAQD